MLAAFVFERTIDTGEVEVCTESRTQARLCCGEYNSNNVKVTGAEDVV
jgi:hypothetical protein